MLDTAHPIRHHQHRKELQKLEQVKELMNEMRHRRRYKSEDLESWAIVTTTQEGIQEKMGIYNASLANATGMDNNNNNLSEIYPELRDSTPISQVDTVSHALNFSSDEIVQNSTSPAFQKVMYSHVIPLMLLFCFLSSLINLFIVLSARWCRKPMSPTLYFSISLALADAYASLVLATGIIVNSLLPYVYGVAINPCLSLALEAFRLGGVLVTVAHLLTMSINYWIGIARPLQYAATMTRRTAIRLIVSCWFFPIATLLTWFAVVPRQGFQSPLCQNNEFLFKGHFRAVIAVFFFAPLILMSGMYMHILVIVRKHIRSTLKYPTSLQLRRNVKAVITTCLILGAYIIGWMPAIMWFILVCENDCVFKISEIPLSVRVPVNVFINILVILKAFVDPIIYAARMADIKAALVQMRYDFFFWFFQSCAPSKSPPKPELEIKYVGYKKNHRLSSQLSSSRCNV